MALLLACVAAPASADPPSSGAFIARAKMEFAARDWNGVVRDASAAIQADSGNANAFRYLGLALMNLGRQKEAIAALQVVTKMAPEDARAFYDLGHAMQASEDLGLSADAVAAYDKAIALNPDLLDAYALKTEMLAAHDDLKGVEAVHEAWIKRAPKDPRAYSALSFALSKLDQPERARAAIDKSLALAPTWRGYLQRARLRPASEAKEALADIDLVLREEPRASNAYSARGDIREKMGDLNGAITDHTKALELWPSSLLDLRHRADLYLRTHQYALAVGDYDRAVAIRPSEPGGHNDRCWVRVLGGFELDLATQDCEVALKAKPGNGAYLDTFGMLQVRRGEYAAAIQTYDVALTDKPKQAESYFGRGIAKLRLGKTAEGQADIAAAERLSPGLGADFAGHGLKP